MADCLFCKMIKGEIKAKVAYEDPDIYAIHDINPQAPVHLLIIPKKHIERLCDVRADDFGVLTNLIATANQLAKTNEIDQRGYRLVINCNPEAGQTVYHIHVHLLGGRPMKWPPG